MCQNFKEFFVDEVFKSKSRKSVDNTMFIFEQNDASRCWMTSPYFLLALISLGVISHWYFGHIFFSRGARGRITCGFECRVLFLQRVERCVWHGNTSCLIWFGWRRLPIASGTMLAPPPPPNTPPGVHVYSSAEISLRNLLWITHTAAQMEKAYIFLSFPRLFTAPSLQQSLEKDLPELTVLEIII